MFLLLNTAYANTLVMIPGAGMTKDQWYPKFIETISKNNTVILVNNKGDSIEQMADNIKLNETVDLIGFSMGGMVAQEKTLHSDKIRKLVLFSTHCGNSQPSKEAQKYYKMPDGDKKIELGIKVRFPEKWIMENAEQVKEYVQFQKGLNFNETLGLMHSNAIESWDGVCDEIKNIKVPTLVIVGDKDEITWTNNAKYIQGQIPDSELTVIKNSGHGLIYQYPDVISRKILDFLR